MAIVFPGSDELRCEVDGARLIEPMQGFESLRGDLYALYSLGRRLGLHDRGTYNPDSRLPGGGRSDHAYWPARAFDLGIEDESERVLARYFYRLARGRPDVGYVIFERRIWSKDRGEHAYTAGGHGHHVHVSGRHPLRLP